MQSISDPAAFLVDKSLANKTVLVFGGTSGIGLATAIQARAAGGSVIVVGSDPGRTERIAAEHGLEWRAADITSKEAVDAALKDIGHVDHLVLLAGSFVAGKILEADTSYLRRAFDERIWAALDVIRALDQRLDPHASVTFISGVLAERPNASGTAVLAAASAAMEALARGLVLELAPRRFNTLSPGTTDTPLLGRTLGDARDGYVADLGARLPLKRIVPMQQAAAAVMFLIQNDFMNGETLHIDGGQRLV
ncbi:short-chain dehydrogenases/reductase, putative [Ricinus communis]|uniref:Short-chain dehydrogenases/reductase, putative n=1 Tax=Ricinus communis TaxID=3988 RepID=B9T8A7_RICCO|nr:short-chain dehydrogenases/reductase, putative [Ricinus communis]